MKTLLFLNSDLEIGKKVIKTLHFDREKINVENNGKLLTFKPIIKNQDDYNLEDFETVNNIINSFKDLQTIVLFYDREFNNNDMFKNILFNTNFNRQIPINVIFINNENVNKITVKDYINYNYSNYRNILFNLLIRNLESKECLEVDDYEHSINNLFNIFLQDIKFIDLQIINSLVSDINNVGNKNIVNDNGTSLDNFNKFFEVKTENFPNEKLSNSDSIIESSVAEIFIEMELDNLWKESLERGYPNFKHIFDSSKVLDFLDLEY